MTYRDETETLRAQVEKLEGELAAANEQIARLRGEVPALPTGTAAADKLVGEPLVFDEERLLPYRVTEHGYEAIAALLKERLNMDVAQVGSAMKGPGFSLTCDGDTTRVQLRTDLRLLRGSTIAGGSLMAIFGGLPTLGILLDLGQHGVGNPLHALWVVPSLVIGAGLGARRLAARRAREGRAKHEGTLAALLDVAAQHRRAKSSSAADASRVRVEVASERAGDRVTNASEPLEQVREPEAHREGHEA